MKPFRFAASLLLGLLSPIAGCTSGESAAGSAAQSTAAQVRAGAETAKPAETAPLGDSDWSLRIGPDATIAILHRGVVVVRAEHITWVEVGKQAPLNDWCPTVYKTEQVRDGRAAFTGTIRGLDLTATGTIVPVAGNELEVDYRMRIAKPHRKIKGAVIDWQFNLNSPTFDRKPEAPVILENKAGWSWRVGPNQSVAVRFAEPVDKIIYEAGNKDNIRGFYIADQVDSGSREFKYTVSVPEGGQVVPSLQERYGSPDTSGWFKSTMVWNASPIDLSFLNDGERPAGRHGLIAAQGDSLAFADGTPVRFWGANLVANALFSTPRQNIPIQARRIAQLGFNLIRIHQHDADWASPNIFVGSGKQNTRHLNPQSLETLDLWIKALRDEGIYIFFDIMWNRALTANDGVRQGYDEIKKKGGYVYGFNYLNSDVRGLMQEFQHDFLSHENRYTRLAYKDDPAIICVLITNENDFTGHFGHMMLPVHKNVVHSKIFMNQVSNFARRSGLPADRVSQTWLPGPAKVFLSDVEHRFNSFMIDDLRELGVRAPLVTTNYWGDSSLCNLAALCDGDVIDVHSYGGPEALSTNPRYEPNFISWIGAAQVQDKPLSISEWTVNYPVVDRCTAPLYLASIASLQGWDAPMLFNYSHQPLMAPGQAVWERKVDSWCSFVDPSRGGLMPAAALAFRQGHISPARSNYCLMLSREQLFDRDVNPKTSATIRTLIEQSRFTVGLPAVKELSWIKPTVPPKNATIVTDLDHDFIPAQQSFVRSDTGELLRSWKYGVQTINTPKTQAVSGWIGGKTLQLADATIVVDNPKAVVALTSIDDLPLSTSREILITTIARVVMNPSDQLPYLSEPVRSTIVLRTKSADLQLWALGPSGKPVHRSKPEVGSDGLTIRLPTGPTHWFLLKGSDSAPSDAGKARKATKKAS
jgi:hypothetical protein